MISDYPTRGVSQSILTSSRIRTLLVHRRRIVCPIKKLHQLFVRHDAWIKLDLHSLSMVCVSGAHPFVAWVLDSGVPARETDSGTQDALVFGWRVVLEENVLHSPETSE